MSDAAIIHSVMKDASWSIVKAKLKAEVDRILDVSTIVTNRPMDEIAVEVRARQLAHDALVGFLATMDMYERGEEKKPPSSRFR